LRCSRAGRFRRTVDLVVLVVVDQLQGDMPWRSASASRPAGFVT